MEHESLRTALAPVFERHSEVVLAYVFGSIARGDAHVASDVDLAVLLDGAGVGSYEDLWADVHGVLGPRPFDLVVLDGAGPVLSFEVIQEGKLVFSRSDEALNDFELKTWHVYQDTRHLRAIGDTYLEARAKEWSTSRNRSASGSSTLRK
ncbi:MAG: nucleotidyltransferase domain-containing protein [Planctomycetes bacterium]|nr:nucleotidyltransferase domain-containing protein [Planctomycetota bacterium]